MPCVYKGIGYTAFVILNCEAICQDNGEAIFRDSVADNFSFFRQVFSL